MADLPGLIEGAHLNKGLGHQFLKHIQRTKAICYVIDFSSRSEPLEVYNMLRRELNEYDPQLLQKPSMIIANKMDLVKSRKHWDQLSHTLPLPTIPISAKKESGIELVKLQLKKLIHPTTVQ
jgi:GTP-binding protein